MQLLPSWLAVRSLRLPQGLWLAACSLELLLSLRLPLDIPPPAFILDDILGGFCMGRGGALHARVLSSSTEQLPPHNQEITTTNRGPARGVLALGTEARLIRRDGSRLTPYATAWCCALCATQGKVSLGCASPVGMLPCRLGQLRLDGAQHSVERLASCRAHSVLSPQPAGRTPP